MLLCDNAVENVRFGSKADMAGEFPMSALPPKADIVHGGGNVRFVPILLQKGVEGLLGQ
jgi:hypothetical protein